MNFRDLKNIIEAGEKFEFEFFWHGPFSQWEPQGFTVDGVYYKTAEHWMMAEKALLFEDYETRDEIIKSTHPRIAKSLGRGVRNFSDEKWIEKRYDIVYAGNEHKFTQSERYKTLLLDTGNKILVEASPVDCIWGIGLDANHPNSKNPLKWRGLNILGFVLTDLRNNLRK